MKRTTLLTALVLALAIAAADRMPQHGQLHYFQFHLRPCLGTVQYITASSQALNCIHSRITQNSTYIWSWLFTPRHPLRYP